MAKNALVTKLSKIKLDDLPTKYPIFGIYNGTRCCGLNELVGVNNIQKNHTVEAVYRGLIRAAECDPVWGMLILTSTAGRKPQLEKLGFKYLRSFINQNSGNRIWMYTALATDIFAKKYVRCYDPF